MVEASILSTAQVEQQVGRGEAAAARDLVDAKPRRSLLAVGEVDDEAREGVEARDVQIRLILICFRLEAPLD